MSSRTRFRGITRVNRSRFANVPTVIPSEILEFHRMYKEDTHPDKIDLISGVFYQNDGKRWVMPLVRKAGRAISYDETLDKERHQMEILGLQSFTSAATKLLLGAENKAIIENRAFGVQTIGSTGAFSIGSKFLTGILGYNTCYIGDPTRQEHGKMLLECNGFTVIRQYNYYDNVENKVNILTILNDLSDAPSNSVVILSIAGHNPTGCDPTREEWTLIADVIEERRLFPFFDCTYQGFASGDLDADAYPVRYFISRGFEMFCAQSFSKNFALYDEPVGNLTVILNSPMKLFHVCSQFLQIVNSMYAYPAYYGARIVALILNNPLYFEEWKRCVYNISRQLIERRNSLRQALERIQTPGIWDHITRQVGSFSYTGLNPQQCKAMVENHHIFMLPTGRISICGINSSNVEYIAKAIHQVITGTKMKQITIKE